ncbi:Bug family tripartite tricarboxylate transporter substrate binding protein [Allopusillimonas ginsengisoli]|uniref:Bug family tripartite tricarboxylate transporter substrate binding protein n=1 Tax=Allopusillimonas ginsengisoli TaxID=453575 RepID=UPI00101F1148|nr:tripartite tricarboxylate transporter substrate binding protein [Allopusillimonas ginsengisoli]TEA69504.1 tripartite tricarboxylate transporter substrate binding protein [Allopusillimonas ginsengisoli]
MKRINTLLACLGIMLGSIGMPSQADTYPERTISVIVPFSPGGNVDIVARLINHKLETELGQSLVTANVSGASGVIGAGQAARAKPDGYTLLANSSAHVIAPAMVANLPYDPLADFIPVSQITQVPMVLLVSSEIPATTLDEFIAYGRARGDGVDYATYLGSAGHLAGELFKEETGVVMNLIPYKSGSTMVTDVMAGRVPAMFDGLFSANASLKTGKVKALAITAAQRSDFLPEIPTFAELGYPDINAETWHGYWVPKGTPQLVVDRLSAAMAKVTAMPDVQSRIVAMGGNAVGSSSQDFTRFATAEHDRWKVVLERAGVKPQ